MNKPKSMSGVIIGQFQFILTPISIWFQGEQEISPLRLYVEKGMQIIGKVSQPVTYPLKKKTADRKFFFKDEVMNKKSFRVYNEQNLLYRWSLYEIKDDQTQNYFDSIQFSLQKSWEKYSKWYENCLIEIEPDLKERNNEKIAEKWKSLIKSAENKQFKSIVLLTQKKISIEYRLEIKNQYDTILEEYQREKERKLREKHQRQERINMRSTIMPGRLMSDPNQLKSNFSHNELTKSEYVLLRTDSNDFNKQSGSRNGSLSKRDQNPISPNTVAKKTTSQKVKFSIQSNQILNGSLKSPSKTKLQNKHSHESSEMLKNQSKILSQIKQDNQHSRQKSAAKNSSSKDQNSGQKKAIEEQQQDMPLIRLQSKTDDNEEKNIEQIKVKSKQVKNPTKIPQPKQTPSSQTTSPGSTNQWTIKSTVMYLLLSVLMLWLTYELMKPTSKI